jgi:hypothetical protein
MPSRLPLAGISVTKPGTGHPDQKRHIFTHLGRDMTLALALAMKTGQYPPDIAGHTGHERSLLFTTHKPLSSIREMTRAGQYSPLIHGKAL